MMGTTISDSKVSSSLDFQYPNVVLSLRLFMSGKEVGSIIGKNGEIVKRFRKESAAVINISDGSGYSRVVTITGTVDEIFKALNLICKKMEEEVCGSISGTSIPRPPITLRLIMPASQCGSLIGKGGSKIKEIREITGASVVVASEMLPNSTERAVTVSGTSHAIHKCIYHICCIMLESPPKGATIPYDPKVGGPVMLAGGQSYAIQGISSLTDTEITKKANRLSWRKREDITGLGGGGSESEIASGSNGTKILSESGISLEITKMANRLENLSWRKREDITGFGGSDSGSEIASGSNGTMILSESGSSSDTSQQSQEVVVTNELIGCVIGKGGAKITEIRQISGAMIRISDCDDHDDSSSERTITITGTPHSVSLAHYLINIRIKSQRSDPQTKDDDIFVPY